MRFQSVGELEETTWAPPCLFRTTQPQINSPVFICWYRSSEEFERMTQTSVSICAKLSSFTAAVSLDGFICPHFSCLAGEHLYYWPPEPLTCFLVTSVQFWQQIVGKEGTTLLASSDLFLWMTREELGDWTVLWAHHTDDCSNWNVITADGKTNTSLESWRNLVSVLNVLTLLLSGFFATRVTWCMRLKLCGQAATNLLG